MEALRGIDQIAYIRFASVYQSFEDLEDLKREVDTLYAEKGDGVARQVSVLSDRDIRAALEAGDVRIDPYDAQDLQPSSVDLHLDRSFRVFRNNRYPYIDVRAPQPDLTELLTVADDEPFILHPGEFVLGQTLEWVELPTTSSRGSKERPWRSTRRSRRRRAGGRWATSSQATSSSMSAALPTAVIAVTPAMVGRPCREVVFSDGHDGSSRTPSTSGSPSTRTARRVRPSSRGRGHERRTRSRERSGSAARMQPPHAAGWSGPVPDRASTYPIEPYTLRRLARATGRRPRPRSHASTRDPRADRRRRIRGAAASIRSPPVSDRRSRSTQRCRGAGGIAATGRSRASCATSA